MQPLYQTYRLLTVLLATLVCGSSVTARAGEATEISRLIEVMTSPTLDWQARLKAEQTLLAVEPALTNRLEILEPLFAARERIGAAHAMYPGTGSLKGDAQLIPAKAQVSYSVSRVWKHHLYLSSSPRIDQLLLRLFSSAKTLYGKRILLNAMVHHFSPEMEPPLAEILRNDEPQPHRAVAAEVLLTHLPTKYATVILDRMEENDLPVQEQVRLFKVFSPPLVKRISDQEDRLVRIGFELLADQKKATPDYPHDGYFTALALASYTGATFKPDQEKDKYQMPHGLAGTFFADTVSNALAWWREHQHQYGMK